MTGEGIVDWKIELENKRVFVTATLSHDEVLEIIKKTGKETEFVGEVASHT